MSESLVGSSSEANSPVSFATTEIAEGKIAEVDKNMEKFDLEDQLEDLMICHDDTSDKSTDTWKTRLELHEDDDSIFSSFNSKFDNRYQVLAIVGDNSEEFDENNNPVLNPANIYRGANHLAEGFPCKQGESSAISRRVEDNQNSHGTRRANTSRCKQEYVVRISLRFKTVVKATSEREN
jgi:hypothetical protein